MPQASAATSTSEALALATAEEPIASSDDLIGLAVEGLPTNNQRRETALQWEQRRYHDHDAELSLLIADRMEANRPARTHDQVFAEYEDEESELLASSVSESMAETALKLRVSVDLD